MKKNSMTMTAMSSEETPEMVQEYPVVSRAYMAMRLVKPSADSVPSGNCASCLLKFKDRHEMADPNRASLLDPSTYRAELQAKLAAMRQRLVEHEADKKKFRSGDGGASA